MKYVLIFILSLLSSFVYADDLSNYPDYFIEDNKLNVIIVVGDKAPATHVLAQTDIALSLSSLVSERTVGLTKLASEVEDIEDTNIISIGNACDNEVTSEILDFPKPCDKNIKQGTSTLEFYGNGIIHIILTSDSDAGIREAASTLANYQNFKLDGNIFVIRSNEKPKIISINENDVNDVTDKDSDETSNDKDDIEILEIKDSNNGVDEETKLKESEITLSVEKNILAKFVAWFFSLFGK